MKVPNTISDKDYEKLQKRADKVAPPFFSKEAADKRKKSSAQKDNADKN